MLPIRLARSLDLAAISRLNEAVLPENYSYNTWHHILYKGTLLVAHDGPKLIGYIAGTWGPWPVPQPYVFSLAIDPNYRERGLASRLLAKLWDQPQRAGRALTLDVRASNTAAKNLYRKAGFQLSQVKINNYGTEDGEEWVRWS